MNTNKRLRFDEATLKQLGLMEEQEKFNVEEHRLSSVVLYSDKAYTGEEVKNILIYLGYNQLENRAVIVVKVGTELELRLANGASKLIKVTQYGSTSNVDESIYDRAECVRCYVPLRDPALD